ncbi:Splicing factor 3B subunit 2, partial [Tolypocladium paradoxum]
GLAAHQPAAAPIRKDVHSAPLLSVLRARSRAPLVVSLHSRDEAGPPRIFRDQPAVAGLTDCLHLRIRSPLLPASRRPSRLSHTPRFLRYGKRPQAIRCCSRRSLRRLPARHTSLQPIGVSQTAHSRRAVANLEFTMAAPKMTKNQMRRAKKKEQKKQEQKKAQTKAESQPEEEPAPVAGDDGAASPPGGNDAAAPPDSSETAAVAVDTPALDDEFADDPAFAAYKDIFTKFGASLEEDQVAKDANAGHQGTIFFSDDDDIPDEDEENTGKTKLSKKKRKQMKTLSVAELKAMVKYPEVVEWHDVSSSDPRLLVQIKAQRNVVPVPAHWSLKREYLSSKRGIEKSAFRLPAFIADTGISEMRDAALEKEAEQSLKQKQRARVQPKMGRLDIDYQKLYDAFFRFQTKPELTRYGEVYYEGKEAEVDYQHFRPGDLGDATKEALGIPPNAPPPWLVNQQRVGPPPSYPTLKIPGLNVPPPPGGTWGYHPGGWGKPPVDDLNRPLYGGDVFGLNNQAAAQPQQGQPELPAGEPIDRTLWGELQPREEEEEEESEEEESEEEDEEQGGEDVGGVEDISGLETPSGYASTMAPNQGVETSIAGEMDLRKDRPAHGTETPSGRAAYTVLKEQKAQGSGGLFGVGHQYDLSGAQRPGMPVLGAEDESRKRKKPGDVDVALDVDSLNQHDGINKDALRQKFEDSRKQEGPGANWQHDEDLADMIAEESRKRQKTEKERVDRRRDGRGRH